jgi:hypothetical protein
MSRFVREMWSGRQDLNLRPPVPQTCWVPFSRARIGRPAVDCVRHGESWSDVCG